MFKKQELTDKIVIVTGAGQGIGKYTAKLFLKEGAKVVFTDINKQALVQLKEELHSENTLFIGADLTKEEHCKHLIEATINKFGKIDILINNAGIGFRGKFIETTTNTLTQVININLMTAIYCTKFAVEEICKSKGSIIFLSSTAGIRGLPFYGPYSIAKNGITAFAEILRAELKSKQVHVGTIILGPTETEEGKRIIDANGFKHPVTRNHKLISLDGAANAIVHCVKNRKNKLTITILSKTISVLHRFFPGLLSLLLAQFNSENRFK